MKKNLIVIASLFVITFSFGSMPAANAQDCQTPPILKELAKKLLDKCKELKGTNSKFADCSKTIDTFRQLESAWNGLVGNSSLHIGPRDMEWNTVQSGDLVTPADRRFISEPIEDGKGATISVKKSGDGKGRCTVSVCAIDIDTQSESALATFSFDEDAKVGTEVTRSFSSAQVGKKILIVRLNGQGIARRFPYQFKASKN